MFALPVLLCIYAFQSALKCILPNLSKYTAIFNIQSLFSDILSLPPQLSDRQSWRLQLLRWGKPLKRLLSRQCFGKTCSKCCPMSRMSPSFQALDKAALHGIKTAQKAAIAAASNAALEAWHIAACPQLSDRHRRPHKKMRRRPHQKKHWSLG